MRLVLSCRLRKNAVTGVPSSDFLSLGLWDFQLRALCCFIMTNNLHAYCVDYKAIFCIQHFGPETPQIAIIKSSSTSFAHSVACIQPFDLAFVYRPTAPQTLNSIDAVANTKIDVLCIILDFWSISFWFNFFGGESPLSSVSSPST